MPSPKVEGKKSNKNINIIILVYLSYDFLIPIGNITISTHPLTIVTTECYIRDIMAFKAITLIHVPMIKQHAEFLIKTYACLQWMNHKQLESALHVLLL